MQTPLGDRWTGVGRGGGERPWRRGLGGGGTEQAEAITSSVCSVTTLALSVSGDLWRGITKTGAGRAVDVG